MSITQQNKEVVHRLFSELYNAKNFEVFDEIIAPDFC